VVVGGKTVVGVGIVVVVVTVVVVTVVEVDVVVPAVVVVTTRCRIGIPGTRRSAPAFRANAEAVPIRLTTSTTENPLAMR
jgi:hypothetical protein